MQLYLERVLFERRGSAFSACERTIAKYLDEQQGLAGAIDFGIEINRPVAEETKKIFMFFDPTGMIQRDDRAAHGIPIIIGRAELQAWLASLELSTPTL